MQVITKMQEPLRHKKGNSEEEDYDRVSKIVYVFSSKSNYGIKFYDMTPQGGENPGQEKLPDGVYRTSIYSISKADWNDHINKENTTQIFKAIDGEEIITTVMVSEEHLIKILTEIALKKQEKGEPILYIDTVDRSKEQEEKEDLKTRAQQNENIGYSKEELENEIQQDDSSELVNEISQGDDIKNTNQDNMHSKIQENDINKLIESTLKNVKSEEELKNVYKNMIDGKINNLEDLKDGVLPNGGEDGKNTDEKFDETR